MIPNPFTLVKVSFLTLKPKKPNILIKPIKWKRYNMVLTIKIIKKKRIKCASLNIFYTTLLLLCGCLRRVERENVCLGAFGSKIISKLENITDRKKFVKWVWKVSKKKCEIIDEIFGLTPKLVVVEVKKKKRGLGDKRVL